MQSPRSFARSDDLTVIPEEARRRHRHDDNTTWSTTDEEEVTQGESLDTLSVSDDATSSLEFSEPEQRILPQVNVFNILQIMGTTTSDMHAAGGVPGDHIPMNLQATDGRRHNVTDEESGGDESSDPTTYVPTMMTEHLGKHRQYWRDILLGVNDGLISTFLLVAGVAGGGLDSRSILLTAIAGTVAGAIAMCAGEFVATKSQNEVMQGEINLERTHLTHYRKEEIKELSELLQVIGLPKEERVLRQQLLLYYDRNPECMLQAMMALEFGVLDEEVRSPVVAGVTNLVLFTCGALPSVIPFGFANNPQHGLIAAAVLTVAALLMVGAVKTWATRGSCVTASVENLVIAAIGGGLAYGVGILFDNIVM